MSETIEKESVVRFVANRLWQVGVASEAISPTTPIWGALARGEEIMRKANEAGVEKSNPEYRQLLRNVRSVSAPVLTAIQFVYSAELANALATWAPYDRYSRSGPPSLVAALDRLYFSEGASFDDFYEELEELLSLIDSRLKAHPTWLIPKNAKAHLEALEKVQLLANNLWFTGAIDNFD